MYVNDQKNLAAGGVFVVLGAATALWSMSFAIGTAQRPGPGFFPVGVGALLFGIGLVVIAQSMRAGATFTRLGRWNLRPVLFVCAAVALFGFLLRPMGLLIALPVLVCLASYARPNPSWRKFLVVILVLLPVTWAIFLQLLGLPITILPRAIGAF